MRELPPEPIQWKYEIVVAPRSATIEALLRLWKWIKR